MNKNINITRPILKIIAVTIVTIVLVLTPGTAYFYIVKENNISTSLVFSLVHTLLWFFKIVAGLFFLGLVVAFCTRLKPKRNREQEG